MTVPATPGDVHGDDMCCNRPAKMLEPALFFPGTGNPFCCDSEQRPVRMATTIFFAGTSVPFCYHHVCFLMEPIQNFAAMSFAFWYNECTILLPPSSVFAGTNQLFCYHRVRFFMEPTQIFATMSFAFGTTSVHFCYHHLCFLLEPINFVATMFY